MSTRTHTDTHLGTQREQWELDAERDEADRYIEQSGMGDSRQERAARSRSAIARYKAMFHDR